MDGGRWTGETGDEGDGGRETGDERDGRRGRRETRETGEISVKFDYLIRQLSTEAASASSVDEYDAPIIHYLGRDLDKAYANRELLRELYSVLKTNDAAGVRNPYQRQQILQNGDLLRAQ